MTQINIKVSGATARAEKTGKLTSGMVGLPVTFSFDDSWDGLTVKAVFSGSGVTIPVELLGATETVVPWEVMVEPHTLLRIGAEGRLTDGSLVIPTTWATVGTVMPGANATDELAKPPTPTAFDIIMSLIGNMDDLTTAAKDSLVAAINEAMTKGGGEIDPESVQQIVEAYLAANPPSDGITPTIADNGNWYLGDTDTGKPSRGEPGPVGATPNIQIGTVETLPAGSPAMASMSGTPENPMLNLGIPKGQTGDAGKSAYKYAQDGGYTGTEAEFAAKMAREMPDKLPNPRALTFTGAVEGSYDGSEALNVEIPSGGSGKAKTEKLIDVTFEEATAMVSVTLEHNFHRLYLVWSCGSNGVARIVDTDGNAASGNLCLCLDSTSAGWNERKIGQIGANTNKWQSSALLSDWTDDVSTFIGAYLYSIATGTSSGIYHCFGGPTAMAGTIGGNALTPTAGRKINIVANGGLFAATTRIVLVGEYYE